MAKAAILAIDQGTTNTKALLVATDGSLIASRSVGMILSYPRPGWAEQCPNTIWQSVVAVIEDVLKAAPDVDVEGLAISNQRETTVLWEAKSGEPVAPAVSWQCRRSTDICKSIINIGDRAEIEARSGLAVDPMFPASKIAWLLKNVPEVQGRAENGELRAGTIDSWLLWKLTAGTVHATDHGNASRTQLMNLENLEWDPVLLDLFNIPEALLPLPKYSGGHLGTLKADITGLKKGIPILAVMGDSHAALYAHGIHQPGLAKVTIGTGSSVMAVSDGCLASNAGLSSTIAWSTEKATVYAQEGNIIVAGNAARFMSQLLGIDDEQALTDLAATVPASDGVCFVPALAGLGAPHWSTDARGLIDGMSLGTKPAHLARATFEAIAHQVADVVDAMDTDMASPLLGLSVDGGASRNDMIMQALACFAGKDVARMAIPEASAMGAARLALAQLGATSLQEYRAEKSFSPDDYGQDRERLRTQWGGAIRRTTQDVS